MLLTLNLTQGLVIFSLKDINRSRVGSQSCHETLFPLFAILGLPLRVTISEARSQFFHTNHETTLR